MQYDFGTMDPYTTSGIALAGIINDWRDAVNSSHSGPTRPAYARSGMVWQDETRDKLVWIGVDAASDRDLLTAIETAAGYLTKNNPSYTGRMTGPGVDGIGAVFNGLTRGIRFYFDTFSGRIEGVDQTGSASYQPLIIGGSEVQWWSGGTQVARVEGAGIRMTPGCGYFNSANSSGINYGGGTAWNIGADMVAFSQAAGSHFQWLRDGVVVATLDGAGLSTTQGYHTTQTNNPSFSITGASGTYRYTRVSTSGGGIRWDYGVDNVAESGSNAGSNFFINRFGDDGVGLGSALTLNRATGHAALPAGVLWLGSTIMQHDGTHMYLRPTNASSYMFLGASNVNSVLISSGGAFPAATGMSLGNSVSPWLNVLAQGYNLKGAAGTGRNIVITTGDLARWILVGTSEAESGGNAGTNFHIYRADDAGGLIDAPFQIDRATGAVKLIKAGVNTITHVPATSSPFQVNGDIAMQTSSGSMLWNLYYDGAWRYFSNGPAFAWRADGVGMLELYCNANNVSGAAAPASPIVGLQATAAGEIRAPKAIPAADNSTRVATTAYVQSSIAAIGSAFPSGVMLDWAGAAASVPPGWYLCDGSLKNRTSDAALFAAIGTTYGAGDGSTTFALPDLRGRVTAGVDGGTGRLGMANVLGAVGGHQNLTAHSHGAGSLATPDHLHAAGSITAPSHQHGITGGNSTPASYTSRAGQGDGGNVYTWLSDIAGPWGCYGSTGAADRSLAVGGSTANAGAGNAENVQPTMAVNKIIKA